MAASGMQTSLRGQQLLERHGGARRRQQPQVARAAAQQQTETPKYTGPAAALVDLPDATATPLLALSVQEPKKFGIAPGQLLNVASAAFPALARLGCGGFVSGYRSGLPKDDGKYSVVTLGGRKVFETSDTVQTFARPQKLLELYEFEVREAICILDLDVMFYPTPQKGPNFRPKAKELGSTRFPFLVDPNTGVSMPESDDIIKYMFNTYGDGQVPLGLRLGILTALSAGLGMLPRALKGSRYAGNGKLPEKPLVYWGYEISPFCKIAREALCELEVPHLYRAAARGSPKRQELLDRRGHFQVPYLEDPNTGSALFESAAIVDHLRKHYGMPASSL